MKYECPTWDEHVTQNQVLYGWEVGDLRFWCRWHDSEVWLAYEHKSTRRVKSSEEGPDDSLWTRWVVKEASQNIIIEPQFPESSVVVKPENSFNLLPDAEARIYVRVPLWIKIKLPGKKKQEFDSWPTVVMSNTWFGDFMEGELCHWLSSHARRSFDSSTYKPHQIVCPVQIRNISQDELLVEKICIRVTTLAIYQHEGVLWANESKIFYRGKEDVSKIQVTQGPPVEAKGGERLAAPQESIQKNFVARTFTNLKSLSGFNS